MTSICRLSFKEAAEAIKGTKQVYCKHGVWNPYELRNTEAVIKSIMNSGYGADVDRDDESGMYYVEIPSAGDMW